MWPAVLSWHLMPNSEHKDIQPPGGKALYANACHVTLRREEVSLMFGLQAGDVSAGEPAITNLLQQTILSPANGKRLASALADMVKRHESKFGPVKLARPARAPAASHDSADRHADRLVSLIEGLAVGYGFERSVRLTHGQLLDNRFLMSVHKQDLHGDADSTIQDVLDRLAMPRELRALADQHLRAARLVHFGFERGDRDCVYKVYLEFPDWLKDPEVGPQVAAGRLLHMAFKWNVAAPSAQAVARYVAHPGISFDDAWLRIRGILQHSDGSAVTIAQELLCLAQQRLAGEGLLYLDVSEDGQPRRSFDVNLYRAALTVDMIRPIVERMGRRYAISPRRLRAWLDGAAGRCFGHLSGGIHRDGQDFFTIYYGVEPRGSAVRGDAPPRGAE